MDNGINPFMESNLQVSNDSVIPNMGWSSFAHWYHLVNGIIYGLAQSDPIKQHLHTVYHTKEKRKLKTGQFAVYV
jgi:hypothetical protein